MAKGVQLRRSKGWRLPAGAMSVARPTRWGNQWRPWPAFKLEDGSLVYGWFATGVGVPEPGALHWDETGALDADHAKEAKARALADCVALHAKHTTLTAEEEALLRGHDLACWCVLGAPCHRDTLLLLANA